MDHLCLQFSANCTGFTFCLFLCFLDLFFLCYSNIRCSRRRPCITPANLVEALGALLAMMRGRKENGEQMHFAKCQPLALIKSCGAHPSNLRGLYFLFYIFLLLHSFCKLFLIMEGCFKILFSKVVYFLESKLAMIPLLYSIRNFLCKTCCYSLVISCTMWCELPF